MTAGIPDSVDVVVSGAGAGGLAAARALGANGLRVLVLDRQRTPAPTAKGEILQPESVRILDGWNALEGVPEMVTRGFVMADSDTLLADGARLLAEVVEQASVEERTDQGLIKEKLRVELRRFIRKRSGRRPFVLPVIMEI